MRITSLVLIGTALTLAACSANTSSPLGSWHQPAGAFIDEGQFGNPTMRNTIAQKCVDKPKGHIVPEYVVVLNPDAYANPKSPQQTTVPQYRRGQVRCSGDLNGKYAEVIFKEYVDSATSKPESQKGGLAEIAGAEG